MSLEHWPVPAEVEAAILDRCVVEWRNPLVRRWAAKWGMPSLDAFAADRLIDAADSYEHQQTYSLLEQLFSF